MSTNILVHEEWKETDIPTAERFNSNNAVIYGELKKSNEKTINLQQQIDELLKVGILNKFYPIGSVFTTTNTAFNTADRMNAHFGGKWETFGGGRVVVGVGGNFSVSSLGGSENNSLQLNNLPSHSHLATISKHYHGITIPTHSHTASSAEHGHVVNQYDHSHTFSFRLRKAGQQTEWHPQAANGNSSNGVDSAGYTTNSTTSNISIDNAGVSISVAAASVSATIADAAVTATIGNTGGGVAVNNMQPYVACYMWRRKE